MRTFYILYFTLICFAVLSKFNPVFINGVYIITILPLAFFDMKKLGFHNYKKGFIAGIVVSVLYFPFIISKISLNHVYQLPQVFAEELFFRGYLISILETRIKNIHLVNIMSSFLFTIPHIIINPSVFSLLVFFPSIIFGYLFLYTRSLVASTLFHWFSNIFFQEFFYQFLSKTVTVSM